MDGSDLKKTKLKGLKENEYIISITSLDASNDDAIGLESYSYDPYKVYPKGILSINGEDTGASLTFKVQERVKRSYTNNTFYITISIIILLIEGIAIYPYIRRQK